MLGVISVLFSPDRRAYMESGEVPGDVRQRIGDFMGLGAFNHCIQGLRLRARRLESIGRERRKTYVVKSHQLFDNFFWLCADFAVPLSLQAVFWDWVLDGVRPNCADREPTDMVPKSFRKHTCVGLEKFWPTSPTYRYCTGRMWGQSVPVYTWEGVSTRYGVLRFDLTATDGEIRDAVSLLRAAHAQLVTASGLTRRRPVEQLRAHEVVHDVRIAIELTQRRPEFIHEGMWQNCIEAWRSYLEAGTVPGPLCLVIQTICQHRNPGSCPSKSTIEKTLRKCRDEMCRLSRTDSAEPSR